VDLWDCNSLLYDFLYDLLGSNNLLNSCLNWDYLFSNDFDLFNLILNIWNFLDNLFNFLINHNLLFISHNLNGLYSFRVLGDYLFHNSWD